MTAENCALSVNHAFWENAFVQTFDELCSRASRKLTHGDAAAAQDIVSDTFTRMMGSGVKPETIQNPISYLWVSIKRAWFHQQRKQDVKNTVLLEDLDAKALDSSAFKIEPKILQVLERQDSLEKMVARFGPMTLEEREMVELFLDNYSLAEVAQEMGEDVDSTYLRWRRLIYRQRYRLAKNRKA
ncbi:MAG TPA: sigma-70 family RNA polymerase sigma factor [Pyrinomonadaceae bacterium]|nr:sigma-70 family RNA polymerase sigma factor [Pyrinomonadaceae bacterium]